MLGNAFLLVNGNRFASKICLHHVGNVIQHVVEGMPRGIVFRTQSYCDLLSRGLNRGQLLKRVLRFGSAVPGNRKSHGKKDVKKIQ